MHETLITFQSGLSKEKGVVGPVQSDDLPFSLEEEWAEAVIRAGEIYVFLQVSTSMKENYFWPDSEGYNTWGKQL